MVKSLGLPPRRRSRCQSGRASNRSHSGISRGKHERRECGRHKSRVLKFGEIQPYFGYTAKEASGALGISVTQLKRLCRTYKIPRWPGRRIKSLEKKIEKLEESLRIEQRAESRHQTNSAAELRTSINALRKRVSLIRESPELVKVSSAYCDEINFLRMSRSCSTMRIEGEQTEETEPGVRVGIGIGIGVGDDDEGESLDGGGELAPDDVDFDVVPPCLKSPERMVPELPPLPGFPAPPGRAHAPPPPPSHGHGRPLPGRIPMVVTNASQGQTHRDRHRPQHPPLPPRRSSHTDGEDLEDEDLEDEDSVPPPLAPPPFPAPPMPAPTIPLPMSKAMPMRIPTPMPDGPRPPPSQKSMMGVIRFHKKNMDSSRSRGDCVWNRQGLRKGKKDEPLLMLSPLSGSLGRHPMTSYVTAGGMGVGVPSFGSGGGGRFRPPPPPPLPPPPTHVQPPFPPHFGRTCPEADMVLRPTYFFAPFRPHYQRLGLVPASIPLNPAFDLGAEIHPASARIPPRPVSPIDVVLSPMRSRSRKRKKAPRIDDVDEESEEDVSLPLDEKRDEKGTSSSPPNYRRYLQKVARMRLKEDIAVDEEEEELDEDVLSSSEDDDFEADARDGEGPVVLPPARVLLEKTKPVVDSQKSPMLQPVLFLPSPFSPAGRHFLGPSLHGPRMPPPPMPMPPAQVQPPDLASLAPPSLMIPNRPAGLFEEGGIEDPFAELLPLSPANHNPIIGCEDEEGGTQEQGEGRLPGFDVIRRGGGCYSPLHGKFRRRDLW